MNGRPIGTKRTVRILVALTILAWATQTLLAQWGFGADAGGGGTNLPADLNDSAPARPAVNGEAVRDDAPAPAPQAPAEAFVPAERLLVGATLELRGEATVYGPEVRLRQVCRWSDADAALFTPVADLIVLRMDDARSAYKSISLDELKSLLGDAKANLAVIRFSGPMLCTIKRSDTRVEQKDTLNQWIDARTRPAEANGAEPTKAHRVDPQAAALDQLLKVRSAPAVSAPAPIAAATAGEAVPAAAAVARQDAPAAVDAAQPAPAAAGGAATDATTTGVRSLRQLLTEDLSVRLNVPVDRLQVTFNPKDERVLNLSEPQFRFNLQPARLRNLGEVAWDVLLVHPGGQHKLPIAATARAWQAQVVAARPIAARQVVRAEDVTERRALVDRVEDDPLLAAAQVVGQQAAREVKAGAVFTARMVESVPLAKPGQYVTVTVIHGNVRVKTVGRAMESGSFGQSIRVKNEATNDLYQVVLTGPQEGVIGAAPDADEKPRLAAGR